VREGAERRVRRERSKSGLFRHSASGRMRVSRARRGQARSGCAGCAGCAPAPARTPRPPGAGAPRRKRAEKTPPKAAHPAHAHTRHQSRCACVSRGYPHAAGHGPAPLPLPSSRRIEAEPITILWYPESLLMNWVVLRHSMTPTCGPLPLWSRLDAETPAHRHDAYPRPLPPAASRV